MSTRVLIIFPYIGDDDDVRQRLFNVIEIVLERGLGRMRLHTSEKNPVLVVNKDTIERKIYRKFRQYLASQKKEGLLAGLDVLEVWAVDTCQMWLDGFGKIIDDKKKDSRDRTSSILLIPGDLKYVKDFNFYVNNLVSLRTRVEANFDFVVGDFEVEPQKSKHLIDVYGTYPLLYNWFPAIAKEIREDKSLGIKRPRSEFLAAKIKFLEHLLPMKRKFAYEQTLAFLIHALSENMASQERKGKWQIGKVDLGTVSDFEKERGLREAIDQIERTERMLKLLWREMNGGDNLDVREFALLDRRSTAIREAAMVSLENFLT